MKRSMLAALATVIVAVLAVVACQPPVVIPTAATTTTTSTTTTLQAPETAPDVLFVQLDDLSIDAGPFYMPRTWAMFQQEHWYRFTQAVAPTPLCGPIRADQLTGQTVAHHLMSCNAPAGAVCPPWIAARDKTVTASLDQRGYLVGWYGKQLNWNYECNGEKAVNGYPNPPGIDDARILGPGDAKTLFQKYSLVENGTKVTYDANTYGDAQYGTYVTATLAENGIERCATEGPCFISWQPMAPHQPGTPADDYDASRVLPGMPVYQPAYNEGCPGAVDPSIADKPARLQTAPCLGSSWKRTKFQPSLQAVDNRLPEMIAAFLAVNPERPKRIVVTSDHGQELGNHRHTAKEIPYEMSIRVPLFIYDSDQPGGTVDRLATTLDLTGTFHEWAGSTPLLPQDSKSLVPLYTGTATSWPDDTYHAHLFIQEGLTDIRPWHALRQDCTVHVPCLKLVKYPASDGLGVEWELYDLTADPWELTQLLPNGITSYPGQPGWSLSSPLVAPMVAELDARIVAGA